MRTLNTFNMVSTFLFVNVLLISVILLNFNPNGLNLLELDYFGGFDITNLLPTNLYSLAGLFLGVVGLIVVNGFLFLKLIK
jgi:hypothetical protein